jgi:hypothetical protein
LPRSSNGQFLPRNAGLLADTLSGEQTGNTNTGNSPSQPPINYGVGLLSRDYSNPWATRNPWLA